MKNNFMKNLFVILTFLLLSACAITNPPGGPGVLYTDVRELVYLDSYVTPNVEVTVCSTNVLGLVATGDNSLNAIKAESKLKKISSIERTYKSVMLLFGESCLIVRGQNL